MENQSLTNVIAHINHKQLNTPDSQLQLDELISHLINCIFQYASELNASDIHFEPGNERFRVRLRVNGILFVAAEINLQIKDQLTSRIKVLANLDIAQKRMPQDGRIEWENADDNAIQCRVSTCPTLSGEKIVIRLLKNNTLVPLNALGMHKTQMQLLKKHLNKQQGLIIVTGSTGSGKTTTLYSALNYLNKPDVNIACIEDPIEQTLPGINQSNINTKAGLTFSQLLRAYLRQDPDIIMVGEIRDIETAEIAIKAAQTGHLVLATLHSNSTIETIQRLTNMGLNEQLVLDTLKLVIAQCMVKCLCEHCKIHDGDSSVHIETAMKAISCEHCHQGYSGRKAIFEVLDIQNHLSIIASNLPIGIKFSRCIDKGHLPLHDTLIKELASGNIDTKEYMRHALHFS